MIRQVCDLIFTASGWKFVSDIPENLRSFILIGAPHTSNHDIVPALAIAQRMKRNAKFVIKDDWLKFPLNLIMEPAGAYGIDRSKLATEGHESNVDLMAQLFSEFSELVLMITPEGTRKPISKWKTGFYYVAQKAKVPIVLGFADYEKKIAGLGPIIYPRDFETDMKTIMKFYKNLVGKRPENFILDSRYPIS